MVATRSDKESDSSQESEDQMANICLMAQEDDSSKVNSKLDTITIEQWDVLYENIYTKYKKLKHENKSLKTKLDDLEHVEIQSRMDEVILAENENLKSKNACLVNKVALLELDVESLTDKLSSSMHEVEDLKYTLARFVKGKNTLDSMLSMKINFQREDIRYTPPKKFTPQKSKTIH